MTVAAVQSSTSSSTAVSGSSAAEISDRFLKLLVTQLKNQDPLNPMDNAEITSQMAQLSTVEGINKMNDSIASLTTQYRATQALQGASLIGRQVLAEGAQLDLGSAGAAGGVDLATKADKVAVAVLNGDGKVVRSLDLGSLDAGLSRFAWDGLDASGNRMAQGTYRFEVTATAAGNNVDATPYSLAQVQSVSMDSTGLNVELSVLGSLSLDKIKQIF
ncbi:MAG: flagellar hook assembly protein FlgD [Pseudomonadota bacterium]|nr:flagellar hook assembly protein FlgD [Pseudomonadota bacterium]